jgi:hypothetical protein
LDIFDKKNLRVIPYVLKKQSLNQMLNLYFEIYNLKKNDDGKTIYTVEYTIKYIEDENVISIFGTKKTNSISTEYN